MTSPPDDTLDLLVAYALDTLEPEEIARVSALLAEQPDLHDTLAELRATANLLPYALPEAGPSPELRQRVLDYATGRAAAPTRRVAGWARGWFLALSGLLAVAVVVAAIGWVRLATTEAELARARSELTTVRLAQQQMIQVILGAETVATLTGGGSGTFVRAADGRAVLAAQLPPLKPGRVYQFWLIQGNNAPVSGGIFTVDQEGRGVLTLAPSQQSLSADTVAVTDEPDPGSPAPTTKPLIAGKVLAPHS